jgi:two-component system chemotaxis response regulator CheB
MNSPIRVLLADDSAVVRRLLTEAINSDPETTVVAAARHGLEAVELLKTTQVDVVLLDVEMPVMDGVEAVHAIRRINRWIPIIMFSSLTVKGGAATMDALAAGATDYVAKPASVGHIRQALEYIRNELLPKLKQFDQKPNPSIITKPFAFKPNPISNAASRPVEIVAIGSSTGGPSALETMLMGLPSTFPVPIVVVQHMPAVFTRLLAERLDRCCVLQVREAEDGCEPLPGQVWIAPGGSHLQVGTQGTRRVLRLDHSPPENSCRPAVDVLFRSVARAYGRRSLGVVLTGMGKDGLSGGREMRAQGGRLLAQDESTSVVWGMPRAIAEAGLAERLLPIQQIGNEIINIVGRRALAGAV